MLTHHEQLHIVKMYTRLQSIAIVAERVHRSKWTICQVLKDWKVAVRRSLPEYVPTQQEIEEATAKIREEWSDAERESRKIGPVDSWEPPVCKIRISHRRHLTTI